MGNPRWRLLRVITFAITLGSDCSFPWLRAHHCDHVGYRRLGRELPWIDVVPLNRKTHAIVTKLRSLGFKTPVNIFLRLTYGAWFIAWFALTLVIFHAMGIVTFDLLKCISTFRIPGK